MPTYSANIQRFDLRAVEHTLLQVERHWPKINRQLIDAKIGAKDAPFDHTLRERMMCAFEYVDVLLADGIEPFRDLSLMLEINNMVHYGTNNLLRYEYNNAIQYSRTRFYERAPSLADWYRRHIERGDHPLKVAAGIYVSVVGRPQLFDEGNHRTGSLISSWIDLYYGFAPFVLSVDNALAYFGPSSEIKHFANKSEWRSVFTLPKYRKSFGVFWEKHIDSAYILAK